MGAREPLLSMSSEKPAASITCGPACLPVLGQLLSDLVALQWRESTQVAVPIGSHRELWLRNWIFRCGFISCNRPGRQGRG